MKNSDEVLSVLQAILAACSPEQEFAANVGLVAQGLGSLAATRFALEAQARLQVAVPVGMIGAGLSLEALARQLHAQLAQQPAVAPLAPVTAHAAPAGWPLTPLQQAFLVTSDADFTADPAGCHLYREIDVTPHGEAALASAWRQLVMQHAVLSAVLATGGALEPGPAAALLVEHVAAAAHDDAVLARRAAWQARPARTPAALLRAALVLSPGQSTLQLSVDGLLMDGHGLMLLLDQWRMLADDPAAMLPAPTCTLADCLAHLTGLAQPYPTAARAYWRQLLATAPAGPFGAHASAVLAERASGDAPCTALARRALRQSVPAATWRACKETAAAWNISPSSLVFALWTETLLEVAGMAAATFLLTLSERPRLPAGAEWLIGPFTSSMLVPVASAAGESAAARAQRLHREIWEHLQHAVVPAVVALRDLPAAAAPGRLPVVFTSLLETPHAASAWTGRTVFSACQTSGIALEHQMWEQDGALELHWDVADALLPAGAAALCQARLVSRLAALVAPTDGPAPLNALQQAYFVARHSQPAHAQGNGCNAVFDIALDGVAPARVAQAWRELVLAHAALHSVVGTDGMVRRLAPQGLLPVLAITPVADDGLAAGAAQVADQLARLPHPLGQWPLQDAHLLHSPCGAARLLASFDLMLLDGQSIHAVMAALVRELTGGAAAAPVHAAAPAPAAEDAVAPYWRARMTALPSGPTMQAGSGASSWQRLEERIAGIGLLEAACVDAGLTLDHVLLAALGAAWQRESAQPFTLASVWWSDDTTGPGERSRMAWPVFPPAGADADAAFPALLRKTRQAVADDLRHGGLAGLPYLAPRHAAGTLALPVVYTSVCRWGTLPPDVAQSLRWRTMTPGIALDAVALVVNDELVLAWDVDVALLADDQAARVFAHYAAAVRRAVQEPAWALGPTRDAAAEPGGVLYDWLHLRCALPSPEPVQLAFERSAARHAALPAVRWRGGTWSFDELNGRANRIARQLRARGIGPGATVAVSVARGPWMVAATLGILKAGGAYVPVEPSLPAARAGRMAEVAGCVLALGLANAPTGLPATLPLLAIDTLPPCADEADNLAALNTAESLAYIIFTSGSTGEPKGVAVAHRALQNLFQWCQRRYRFGPGDLGLCVTSLGFDLSVFDLLGLLGDGAAIYVADETQQRDPALLAALLVEQPITFWNSAPTTLDQVSAHFDDLAGTPAARALRLVFLSGDYTPISLPPVLACHFPQARLVSLGGATEATVWSNFHEVDHVDPAWRSIPYGRPIDNARYYILDDAGQPCGPGVEGHLYIAGDVLSLGYFGRPELTQERFLSDPFVPQAGARMYRTGDLAVFAPDGMMFFRGRADRQVKVRGMRIEPDEIEHVLRQHPQVRDVVVLAQRDADGDVKLVAYVIASEPVSAHALRTFAAQKLPAAMVPNLVHAMARFPATSNGKLDRAALPWPLPAVAAAPAPAVPGLALEQIIAELLAHFQRSMGTLPEIDRDLWEQGATSFTIIQVSAALKAAHGLKLQVEWLTRRPTVRGIAEMVAEKLGAAAHVPPQPAVPASAPAATVAPAAPDHVEVLDSVAKQAFLDRRADRRADLDGQPRLALGSAPVPDAWFDARGARREFGAGTVGRDQLAQLLGLLATRVCAGRRRHLYPSAGDTYSVQVYLWIKGERVDGVATGYYWYDPDAAALVPLAPGAVLPRETQFIYNRPLVDRCALALFLVGEQDAIAPLYGSAAERFQLLEAGYIGQLLMLGQQQCGLGLCPIGSFDDAGVRASLRLDTSQQVLHSFLAGPTAVPVATPAPLAFAAPALAPAAIGIVGHALRYPGASTPEAFWQMLRGGASVLRAAPQRRGLGKQGTLVGGFLDDIEGFDAALFGISPSEARLLDPQARLLLEVVWECLERAGHDAASLQRDGERVGVYCGHLWLDYRLHGATGDATVSASGAELAGRIAQAFGFTGPAIAIDTACTGGLAALHLAAGALVRGDCDSAIVCAVNLLTHPAHGETLEAMGLVAKAVPDGIYDGGCTGWAAGEGAGAVLLRRRDAAGAAADQLLALLDGSHVEQAGARSQFGSPSSAAVEAGLRAVLRRAGLGAHDIDYVECAASGAALSDSAEWDALRAVFEGGVRIGSVKPLIGHLEAASGMAQLSKVLLQLAHGELAPTRVAARPSPLVDLAGPIQVVTAAAPLARSSSQGAPARVLINAVASTGGSVQVILTAPPAKVAPAVPAKGPGVLLVSAASAVQLELLAGSYRSTLQAAGAVWDDICATSQLARASGMHRLAVEASDAAEAHERLVTFLRQRSADGVQQTRAQAQYLDRRSAASDYRGALQDWLAGYQVDWLPFWQGTPGRALLPTYPFARMPYWLEAPQAASVQAGPGWLERVMAAYAAASGLPVDQLDPHVPLERYGLNSRIAAAVVASLNEQAGGSALHATLLYEARDLHAVALLCATPAGAPATAPATPVEAGAAIAIVGLAGRYPGADDIAALWQKLAAGVDLVCDVPAQRQGGGAGAALLRGAFLDDVAGFDPFLFGIAPADAARMDPQERILLETTWQALEDAGYPPERLRRDAGARVGVYVGAMHNEYPLLGRDASTPERLIDTGATPAGIANRISYHLDLHGPSLTVDTMCSSGLTALQLAVEALRAGRITMAIVGSVNLSIHPNKFVQQARLQMTAPGGRCRSFGAGGDGFVPGEGAAVLVLRAAGPARAAHDRIHGLVLGCAVGHGGKVNGFTVPSPQAQQALVEAALADAGVAAATVSYVEAHGTGTALGDPIEARALAAALALQDVAQPLAIGSIKSNLGHLEAAAGLAGLTKVLLQMRHRTLVPSLHSAERNGAVDWTWLRVPQQCEPWKPRMEGARAVWRAGVSAFGAGGSNAHVIVEAPEESQALASPAAGPQLLVLSAASEAALLAGARQLARHLEVNPAVELGDVAATLQWGRAALRERWAAACDSVAQAIALLRAFAAGEAAGWRGRAATNSPDVPSQATLAEQARMWVAGGQVAWAPRWRPMVTLPSYAFTRMKCWVDDVRDPIVPPPPQAAMLAERVWRPAEASMPAAQGSGDVLCAVDAGTIALGRHLAAALAPRTVRFVELGADAAAGAPAIARGALDTVVVLAGLGDADAGWQRAFDLCRGLARGAALAPLHILHVTCGMHAPAATGAGSSGAVLAGLLHALAAESTGLTVTVLDVDELALRDDAALARGAALLRAELALRTPGDICVTRLGRFRPVWTDVVPAAHGWRPEADALYLITGGTRGLGANLARQLVRRGARRLVLLARQPGPHADQLAAELSVQGAQVRLVFGSLEGLDLARMLPELAAGPFGGIFHCAGIGTRQPGALAERPLAEIEAVLAPKTGGLAALLPLLPLLAAFRPRFVLAFSSISATMPATGVGVGDYAAANAAMEYLAEQHGRRGCPELMTLAWPVWQSSSANAAAVATMARHGLPVLNDEQAFGLLWTALATPTSGRMAAVPAAALPQPQAAIIPTIPTGNQAMTATNPTDAAAATLAWLRKILAQRLQMPIEMIPARATFAELGIESVMLGRLVEDIEAQLGRPLAPSALLEHPTAEDLAAHLAVEAPQAATAPVASAAPPRAAVAVVGMAVRVPGAADATAFGTLLREGRCAIGDVPPSRWDVSALYDAKGRPGSSISRWGGFVDGIEDFDPDYFNMSEASATCLDPAVRLLLEGAAACLRDAGLADADVRRQNIGVYVGARMGDYRLRAAQAGTEAGLGTDQNFIAAHVAHHFDLRGPNFVVDSACSSSLTALHLACQGILSGDTAQVLVGGVDVLLDEEVYVQFSKARALSPGGRCRTFDQHADGFVPGEGCVVLLLKRLDLALAQGDRIHAVIEGSAVNNDGRTMGLTTPNPEAQQEVIRAALARAGRGAQEVGMVEAHGTATMIGDPIELKALNDVFRTATAERSCCAIGSVKTNIGHLLSAAGAAGLAKVILAVRDGVVPPSLFCDTPNPRFDLAASPFFVPAQAMAWPRPGTRVAGVSAFGLGGTNAHVVVAEAPPHRPTRQPLPPPRYERRRLWLDRPGVTGHTLSLLQLQFIDPAQSEVL